MTGLKTNRNIERFRFPIWKIRLRRLRTRCYALIHLLLHDKGSTHTAIHLCTCTHAVKST